MENINLMETPKSTKQCETLVASFNQQIKDMQLIDIKQKFTDYEVITSKLELNRPILITKAVMQRYVELNHRLKQWFKESESSRLWEIISSLYCWLKKAPVEEITIVKFEISALINRDDENLNSSIKDKVIEENPLDSPESDYLICCLKAVVNLAEGEPIIIMLAKEV